MSVTRTSLYSLCAISMLTALLQAGEIRGTLQDRTGAHLPQGTVVAHNLDNGQEQSVKSDAEGSWRFGQLPGGRYTLRFAAPGFQETRSTEITLTRDGVLTIDQKLDTASVRTEVLVSADADLVQTTRSTQSSVLTSQQIVSIPTASRNITHLIVNEPGIAAPLPDRTGKGMNLATAPGSQSDDGTQSLNPSVNGARPTNNSLQLNGLDITNMMNGAGGLGSNVNVPLDALQEVEVQTALYSASTGRNGGGNIQLITKSGSGQFHGGVYHYLQNEALNANEFFLNRAGTARPQFRRNETGINLGGPIRRNKTYFFASVQRTDFLSGYASNAIAKASFPTGLSDVRTRESIAGVANAWLASGNQVPGFAKALQTALLRFPAEQQAGLLKQFFSDVNTLQLRQLTPEDIHPVAVNILNQKRDGKYLIPSVSPNFQRVPASVSFGEEYLQTLVVPTSFNSWSGLGTIDHYVSSNNRLRLNYLKSSQHINEAFGWADASPSPTLGEVPGWSASLSDTHNFGPHWMNEVRGGFFELYNTRISLNRDITNSSLGIYNPLESAIGGLAALMPTIDIVGASGNSAGIGNAWDFFDRQRVINVSDQVSYTNGKHTFQFGGEWRRPTLKGEYMARVNGDLDYDNWLLFFTGHGASGGGSDLDQGDTRRHFEMNDFSFYAQDDWRIHPRLTLNIGLRYDFYGNPVDADGRIGNYYLPETAAKLGVQPGFQVPANSAIFNPNFTPTQIGLVVAPGTPLSLDQVHKAKYDSTLQSDYNNFAPRFGFAWRPFGTNSLAIRGGYGMFYERPSGVYKTDLQLSAPYFIYQNVPAPADMARPYPSLNINPFQIPITVQMAKDANGAPRWVRYDGSPFPSTEPFSSKSNTFIDPLIRTPYVQQWTANIQWEPVRNHLVDIRYVGSKGTGLLAKLNLTQPRDPRKYPVNGFTDIYDKAGRLISPDFFVDPQFLGLSRNGGFRLRSNWGHSTYHGLQVGLRRRFSQGLTLNAAYTFSKALDNVSNDNGVIEHDAFNSRLNRGPASFDRTHRLTVGYSWDLPKLYGANRLVRTVLSGWTQAGMLTAQSGTPFTVYGNATTNAIFSQPSVVRVSMAPGKTIADAVKSGRTQDRIDQYFNTAAFVDSGDTWGNEARNALRGPSQKQLDLSLGKRFRLTEGLNADFRWEAYNITNTPVFANPASTFAANGPGTAGRITDTIGGPRTMQAALRVTF